MMSSLGFIGRVAAAASLFLLIGCSGGGGGSTAVAPSSVAPAGPAFPASGIYAHALKLQGSVNAPDVGISLVHSSVSGVEFEIEAPTNITDLKTVYSGNVAGSAATVSDVKPYALLYIANGDVRRVSLRANGLNPTTQVQKAGVSRACKFLVEADNYAEPEKSRFMVSTMGSDGTCGTSDDGQGEITLDSTGGVHYALVSSTTLPNPVLGAVRDPQTLAPAGWVYGDKVSFWGALPSSVAELRTSSQSKLSRVVVSAHKAVVAEYNNQLTLLEISKVSGQAKVTESLLDATLTAGSGWESAGFDADNYYVYRNTSTTYFSIWTVLKIDRASHAVTRLATGSGYLGIISMGSTGLYATVLYYPGNHLLRIEKSAAGTPLELEDTGSTNVVPSVLTSAHGVHMRLQRWASGLYAIRMIDEAGNTLYTASNAMLQGWANATGLNLNRSESTSHFVFATDLGSRGYADAPLVAYNTATRTAVALGKLPGAADFGSDPVIAGMAGDASTFLSGYVARLTSSGVQANGAKLYSFEVDVPNSLKTTTSKQ